MRLRLILVGISCLGLASCSEVYEVRAEVRDGQIVFTAEKDWFRERCVSEIEVLAEGADSTPSSPQSALQSDAENRPAFVTVWRDSGGSLEALGDDCENRFPVRYGEPLAGKPLDRPPQLGPVGAKPLARGVVHKIRTTTHLGEHGWGSFVIHRDGTVENLD